VHPILVAGTGSWNDDARVDWYTPGSRFARFLEAEGLAPTFGPGAGHVNPFVWSTSVAGIPVFSRRATWPAAGIALAYFITMMADLRGHETAIIAHSHALQVVLYACVNAGIKVAHLISVESPVRRDMLEVATRARPLIGHWLHIYSDWSDRWQWLGELFDGHLGVVRAHPLADRNDSVAGVGHSALLRDPTQFYRWTDLGWLDPLRGPRHVA